MNDDLISRQAVMDALEEQLEYLQMLNKHENPKAESKWYGVNWARNTIADLPSADRPQGYWTKTDVATYRCSECGKIQIADDVNELNYCCCCGSRNKVRRKGADDEDN